MGIQVMMINPSIRKIRTLEDCRLLFSTQRNGFEFTFKVPGGRLYFGVSTQRVHYAYLDPLKGPFVPVIRYDWKDAYRLMYKYRKYINEQLFSDD